MSNQWDETCLVCCKKTKKRCGKCAEAGIDLFFCSPQHQQLVWGIHKRVCGPGKANPFVWPLLSKDEAREVIENLDKSTGVLSISQPERNTVAKALQQAIGCSREQVPMLVEKVTVGTGGQVAAADDARQQLLLVSIRAFELSRLTIPAAKQSNDNIMGQPRSGAFRAASGWDLFPGRDSSTSCNEYGREPWRAKARHYTLMHGAMFDLALNGHEEAPKTLDLHRRRLADHVAMGAADSNPRFAAEYRAQVDRDERVARGLLKQMRDS